MKIGQPGLSERKRWDHIVNNLPAEDTSPSSKMFLTPEELFASRGATTTVALHV
jgi:hypothetical protein